jgi:hypothetical protein
MTSSVRPSAPVPWSNAARQLLVGRAGRDFRQIGSVQPGKDGLVHEDFAAQALAMTADATERAGAPFDVGHHGGGRRDEALRPRRHARIELLAGSEPQPGEGQEQQHQQRPDHIAQPTQCSRHTSPRTRTGVF